MRIERALSLACVALTGAAAAIAGAGQPVAAATGQTPGTYADWSAPATVSAFTMPMTLEHDPGNYNAFWSNQFWFDGASYAGYMGFQTHADGGGMFLVSIWNATSATPGSGGAYCQVFQEGGSGETCRMNARPVQGHVYELTATQGAGSAWTFSYADTTAHSSQTLGTIVLDARRLMQSGFVSWTEYYDWNNPATVCTDARYSRMLFGIPRTSAGAARYTGSSLSSTCQSMARVTLGAGGATEEDGPLPAASSPTPSPVPTHSPAPPAPPSPRPTASVTPSPPSPPRATASPAPPSPAAERPSLALLIRTMMSRLGGGFGWSF